MSRTFKIIGPESGGEIIVNDDEMIVYDVVKIKDYEGDDYVPRAAKKKGYVMHLVINPEREDDELDKDEEC